LPSGPATRRNSHREFSRCAAPHQQVAGRRARRGEVLEDVVSAIVHDGHVRLAGLLENLRDGSGGTLAQAGNHVAEAPIAADVAQLQSADRGPVFSPWFSPA
jgi:hypothetical protein